MIRQQNTSLGPLPWSIARTTKHLQLSDTLEALHLSLIGGNFRFPHTLTHTLITFISAQSAKGGGRTLGVPPTAPRQARLSRTRSLSTDPARLGPTARAASTLQLSDASITEVPAGRHQQILSKELPPLTCLPSNPCPHRTWVPVRCRCRIPIPTAICRLLTADQRRCSLPSLGYEYGIGQRIYINTYTHWVWREQT